MPQNLAGWLVRWFRSTLLIKSISSLDSSKSNTWKFSFNLSILDVFGMITVFLWMPHRSTIWATDLLYFLAKPWIGITMKQANQTHQLKGTSVNKTWWFVPRGIDSALTLRTGSSKQETDPNHSVLAAAPPIGVWAVTQIPCFWQNLTRGSRWK